MNITKHYLINDIEKLAKELNKPCGNALMFYQTYELQEIKEWLLKLKKEKNNEK